MNRRIKKKRVKARLEWFTQEKIPLAFGSEKERKLFVRQMTRRFCGQSYAGRR